MEGAWRGNKQQNTTKKKEKKTGKRKKTQTQKRKKQKQKKHHLTRGHRLIGCSRRLRVVTEQERTGGKSGTSAEAWDKTLLGLTEIDDVERSPSECS